MSDTAGALHASTSDPKGTVFSRPKMRNILGVDVRVIGRDAAVNEIQDIVKTKGHRKFAFMNAHGGNLAHLDAAYRGVLKQFEVLPDGIGVDLGSKILFGEKFPNNLNGTDFIPHLFRVLAEPVSVALLGARPVIADQAAEHFERQYPAHSFSVLSDGYFDAKNRGKLLQRLKQQRPDILLVAFGNPKQEMWIADNCTIEHTSVPIGVGALFDFVAGSVPRAPRWMISARIEWLYRLWLEPGRMWRRYVLGNPLFILRVLSQKFSRTSREGS